MPTVARVTRQVSTIALPGVRKTAGETPTSAGAGLAGAQAQVGEAIAGVGSVVARIGAIRFGQIQQEERDHADSVALLEAERRLGEFESNELYTPETGALARKGKNALKLPEEVGDKFTTLTGEIEKGLNPRQLARFQPVKVQRATSLDLTLKRHVFGEMQRYEADELEGLVANKQSSAIANAMDPRRVAEDLGGAVTAIKEHGPRLGLGPEAVAKRVEAITSDTYIGVIGRLLENENDAGASAYFAEVKDQIAGKDLAKVEKAIGEGTLRGQAQDQAAKIIDAGGTLKEQLEKLGAIDDRKLRDAVRERVEHNSILMDRQEREQKEAASTSIYNAIEGGASLSRVEAMPGWQLLSGGERSGASSYLKTRLKGVPVETDYATFYELMEIAQDDPSTFSTVDLMPFRGKLADSEFEKLIGLKGAIKDGNRRAAAVELDAFATKGEMLEDALVTYGIDPRAKPNTDEGRAIAKLRQMLDQRVEMQSSLTGKKPTNEDMRKSLDELLSVSHEAPGSWWNVFPGGQSGPFEMTQKPLIRTTIADVPTRERKQIEETLRKDKVIVNDANIYSLWLETKLRLADKK